MFARCTRHRPTPLRKGKMFRQFYTLENLIYPLSKSARSFFLAPRRNHLAELNIWKNGQGPRRGGGRFYIGRALYLLCICVLYFLLC